jgi:anti-anti-sigma factor
MAAASSRLAVEHPTGGIGNCKWTARVLRGKLFGTPTLIVWVYRVGYVKALHSPPGISSKAPQGGSAMTQTAFFSSDRIGDYTEVLTLNGECDRSAALHAEQQIVSAIDAGRTEIIFDLRGVTSLGRSMLQVLFRALIRMGQNGRLVLVRPNASVWVRFEQSGLDKGFSSFPDLKGALAAVSIPRSRLTL